MCLLLHILRQQYPADDIVFGRFSDFFNVPLLASMPVAVFAFIMAEQHSKADIIKIVCSRKKANQQMSSVSPGNIF